MNRLQKHEITAALVIVILLLGSLFPSLSHARRERRDTLRRQELAQLKIALERYNNEHGTYPLTFATGPYQYVVTTAEGEHALAWYLRTTLENRLPVQASFDFDEGRNYYFRVTHEGSTTFYDICGGTDTCGAPPRERPQ